MAIVTEEDIEYNEHVEHCLGSIQRPMFFDDCADKFKECAPLSIKPLSDDTIEKKLETIARLEKLDDATEIIRMLR